MDDFEELEFVIPAYTPETMPLDRLLQYLQQIGEVLGVAHDMHLIRIEASSTKPVFKMPAPVAIQARDNGASVQRGAGTIRQRTAYNRIRQMVRRDSHHPASVQDRQGVIVDFPPAPEAGPINGVRQPTSFDGELLRVGGASEFTPILMRDLAGEIYSGFSAPRQLAKEIAARLFEPIRVSGIGSWDRSKDGEWKLAKMLIQSYEPLSDEDLGELFRRLQSAPVAWPENADELLRAERESGL